MRRVLSILLIALFGLTPLAALAGSRENARIPVCCRRRGAHHCEMPEDAAARIVAASSGRTATVSAPSRCPLYPGVLHATLTPVFAVAPHVAAPATLQAAERVHTFPAPQADSSSFSAYAVRGPPAAVLA
jgi:hypothetical protein